MESLLGQIKIRIHDRLFVKDPETSDLGQRILETAIDMIADIGFESFTFKKLGDRINSPESSIYRYFENKHQLLVYLINWYWGWLEYRLVFKTANISDDREKLRTAIQILSEPMPEDSKFPRINERLLHQIIVSESAKAYLTKEVDRENKDGYYQSYKRLVQRMIEMIEAVAPNYEYPRSLISTVVEGSHLQQHFGEHLPSLTDIKDTPNELSRFFDHLVFSALDNSVKNG